MVTFFVWTCYGEWGEWCRCPRHRVAEIEALAARCGLVCDWVGF